MLRFFRVRNFALIDHLEIHFEDGFNLLSGETGAGKSIIVDALALIAGAKALSETVRTGESRAIVEAVFEANIADRLERVGLDAEGAEVIIRREISSDGRNRVCTRRSSPPARAARSGSCTTARRSRTATSTSGTF